MIDQASEVPLLEFLASISQLFSAIFDTSTKDRAEESKKHTQAGAANEAIKRIPPMPNTPHRTIVINQDSTSGVAMAGLVFAILGWFTCGMLCIPGAALSFSGLFSKGPKGTAVAGLIVGFPGVLFFIFWGLAIIAGMLGIGAAGAAATGGGIAAVKEASAATKRAQERQTVVRPVENDRQPPTSVRQIPRYKPAKPVEIPLGDDTPEVSSNDTNSPEQPESASTPTVPAPIPDEAIPQPQPVTPTPTIAIEGFRTWNTADGKHSTLARLLSMAGDVLTLEKQDGTKVKIPLDRLSEDDREFVKEWKKGKR